MALPCAILWPDTHFPFEHKKAVRLVLKVADFLGSNLREIVFLGDLADFYYVNSHGKHASMVGHLKDEVDAVNEFLDLIDKKFPRQKKTYIEGNHEWRLERFINDKAPELFGLFDCESLFKMRERPGWRYVSWTNHQRVRIMGSALWARHRPLANTAKGSATKAICNLVYGDIHRIEESHMVGLDGTNYVNFSVGWLGDKRKNQVFGYVANQHQWQLGFGIVYVCPRTKLFYHHKIHILEIGGKLSCVVNGRKFEG